MKETLQQAMYDTQNNFEATDVMYRVKHKASLFYG